MHEADDNRIFQRECRGLARLGHESVLVVTHDGEALTDGVRIVPLKRRKGISRRILSSLEAMRKAAALDADVYHFHDPDLLPWMWLLSRTGKVVVYDVHENYEARFYQWRMPSWLRRPAGRAYRVSERFFVRGLAGVTTVSEAIRARFEGSAGASLVLANVPDLDMFDVISVRGGVPKPPVVITSGHNGPDRQCLETVEALPWILEARDDVIVRFVGRYPDGYADRLRERAVSLGVEASLEVIGWVPVEKSYRLIAESTVGCVFYEDNINNRSALGNRIFEYMCCGIPVLAQDFPELRRVIESAECGLLVNSSDPRDIARGVLEIVSHPERAMDMGRKGRSAIENRYNFQKQLRALVVLFQQLVPQPTIQPTDEGTGR